MNKDPNGEHRKIRGGSCSTKGCLYPAYHEGKCLACTNRPLPPPENKYPDDIKDNTDSKNPKDYD